MTDIIIAKVAAGTAAASATASIVLVISDSVANTAITQIGLVLMASVAAYFAYKAKKTAEETKAVAEGTHDAVNDRLEKFIKVLEEKFFAEGKLAAKEEAIVISAAVDKAKLEAKVEPTKEP